MKQLIIMILFVVEAFSVSSQEVVSPAGETQTISGTEISWTIGEPVIETAASVSNILTQGFHQSKLTVTAIDELLSSDFKLKVYPNPTSEFVTIHFNKPDKNPVYSLLGLKGNLIETKTISSTETSVNLQNFASGTYLLKISGKNNTLLQTFKIVKK